MNRVEERKVIGVDIGNTAVKTAEFFSDRIGEVVRWTSLEDVMHVHGSDKLVLSAVGKRNASLEPYFEITSKSRLPIKLNYQTPETLGADRIAAAVGAWIRFPGLNILIIDGGTCITYDVVTADGTFQGGIISPGLETRFKAMHSFTAGLPMLTSEPLSEAQLIGKTTIECMRIGAQEGLNFEINGFLETFNKKYDRLQVVITGGLAPGFESKLKAPIFASSKIVLEGMHAIWKINEGI
jgi:type III pantothenate kinase